MSFSKWNVTVNKEVEEFGGKRKTIWMNLFNATRKDEGPIIIHIPEQVSLSGTIYIFPDKELRKIELEEER